jgi:hypothetical protein
MKAYSDQWVSSVFSDRFRNQISSFLKKKNNFLNQDLTKANSFDNKMNNINEFSC